MARPDAGVPEAEEVSAEEEVSGDQDVSADGDAPGGRDVSAEDDVSGDQDVSGEQDAAADQTEEMAVPVAAATAGAVSTADTSAAGAVSVAAAPTTNGTATDGTVAGATAVSTAGSDGAGPATPEPGDSGSGRRRGRLALIVVAVVVVLLGAGYGVIYAVAGDKLAQNASVAGIDVGGLTPAEAQARLEAELPAIVDVPISIHLGDTDATYEIVPSEAGLLIDIPATIGTIPGGNANPVSLAQALFGGEDVDPVADVDVDALRGSIEAIAEQSDSEPVNGAIDFEEGEVVTSDPVTGQSLDVDAAVEVVSGAFFGPEARELPIGDLTVPVDEIEPDITQAELDRALSEFAEPAMSGPVTVVAGDESIELSAELIGEALSVTPDDDGVLQPELDGEKLVELAEDELAELGHSGRDATVRIENGSPVVVPAESGQSVETDSLGQDVLSALTEEGDDRSVEGELVEVDPDLTTSAAEELGVKEVVAEFTTNFPPAAYRDTNIGRAAELINNTLLEPGEEFSLNNTVGERTEANGFTSGIIINQGRLEDAMGGGVSQVATTTYHAAFLAGLEDVEHWPHSIYFDRYPVGQEATVAWGSKDLRFKNDTPYGVLIEARVTPSAGRSQGTLTVRIWSTEHYRVQTSVSDRSNFTSPRTIYDTSSGCSPQGGSQGFNITSYRKVWTVENDELVKDESFPWTYNPNHRVVCGPEPD